jgi:type II secretory pathway component GspD/PulD (secretin)
MYRSYIVPMQIQFMDVGTKLEVTARVNDDNSIEMEISAEDSSAVLRDIQSGTGYSTTVPVKTENSVVTKVVVGNGEAIAIGGLRIDTATKDVDKIPFLGDIPVLGHLFKSTTRRTADKELLIFLRPEIVEEAVSDEEAKLEQFRQKLVDRVRQSDRLPFDLGDKQKPLIRDRETRKNKTVLPFVPRKSDKEKPLS